MEEAPLYRACCENDLDGHLLPTRPSSRVSEETRKSRTDQRAMGQTIARINAPIKIRAYRYQASKCVAPRRYAEWFWRIK
jgi:hypothetical protein